MSARAEIRRTSGRAYPVDRYDRIPKTVHWASVLLVTAAFAAVWASYLATSRQGAAVLVELHRSLGVTICALTLGRLAWRWCARVPPLPADLPALQRIAARSVEASLYLLLLLQPILGILQTNARGRQINFYFLGALPPIVSADKLLAKPAMAAHELVGYCLLSLIALHAAAALFHHFIRRDGVLRTMLPGSVSR